MSDMDELRLAARAFLDAERDYTIDRLSREDSSHTNWQFFRAVSTHT